MRIPFTKPYRAFEEFDGVSRAECERFLRRSIGQMPWLGWVVVGVFVLGTSGAGFALFTLYESAPGWHALFASDGGQNLAISAWVALSVLSGAIAALLARDGAIFLGIRREIHRARCPKCRHSLLGLPIHAPHSIGTPIPGDAWVRCAECGKRVDLLAHGLTPRDLIPFEMREVRLDVGQRGGDWFGRKHPFEERASEREHAGWSD